jgi:hypothetical protein
VGDKSNQFWRVKNPKGKKFSFGNQFWREYNSKRLKTI